MSNVTGPPPSADPLMIHASVLSHHLLRLPTTPGRQRHQLLTLTAPEEEEDYQSGGIIWAEEAAE